jgi:hypothetical protein
VIVDWRFHNARALNKRNESTIVTQQRFNNQKSLIKDASHDLRGG